MRKKTILSLLLILGINFLNELYAQIPENSLDYFAQTDSQGSFLGIITGLKN